MCQHTAQNTHNTIYIHPFFKISLIHLYFFLFQKVYQFLLSLSPEIANFICQHQPICTRRYTAHGGSVISLRNRLLIACTDCRSQSPSDTRPWIRVPHIPSGIADIYLSPVRPNTQPTTRIIYLLKITHTFFPHHQSPVVTGNTLRRLLANQISMLP